MSIEIKNPGAALAAETHILGAAIKVMVAGGSKLSSEETRRTGAISYYLWHNRRQDIEDLVRKLETAE